MWAFIHCGQGKSYICSHDFGELNIFNLNLCLLFIGIQKTPNEPVELSLVRNSYSFIAINVISLVHIVYNFRYVTDITVTYNIFLHISWILFCKTNHSIWFISEKSELMQSRSHAVTRVLRTSEVMGLCLVNRSADRKSFSQHSIQFVANHYSKNPCV